MARVSPRNPAYDPLDYITTGIPVSLTSQLREISLERGVTMQSLVREAVKDWVGSNAILA